MRLYIAGAYANKDRVRHRMLQAKEAGHVVVHDWPTVIEQAHHRMGIDHDRDVSDAEARQHAVVDILEIRGADVFWLLSPPEGRGRGCWVELGVAYAEGLHIIVSGETCRDSIFTALGWRYGTDEEALRALEQMDRETEPPAEGWRGSSA